MGMGRDFDPLGWVDQYYDEWNTPRKKTWQSGTGDYKWKTARGDILHMNDMSLNYLRNAYNMCQKTGNTGKGNQLKEILEKKEKEMGKQQYNVGDIVVKVYGKKPLEVVWAPSYAGSQYKVRYIHSGAQMYVREREIKPYEGDIVKEGNGNMNGKLYQVKATGEFGVWLAVNSAGEYVLEMKNSGQIMTFKKDEVEVVMPYTFAVQWHGNGGQQHFRGKAGVLKVGDLILETGKNFRVGVVAKVNTKRENVGEFKGVKLVTEAIYDETDEEVVES